MKIIVLTFSFFFSTFLMISCNNEDNRVLSPITEPSIIIFKNDVKIFAHRGFHRSKGSAENSITSLIETNKNRIHGVEMDLRMSKDSVMYLHHDPVINGNVIQFTNSTVLDQQKISNGEFLPRFSKYMEKLSTYEGLLAYIEIKEGANSKSYNENAVLQTIKLLNKYTQFHKNYVILSFNLTMCKLSKNFAPNLRTMYLSNNPIYDYIILKQNKIDEIGYNYKVLNQDINIVKMANENGFGVSVWTVDDLEDIKKYSGMKVSAIISDNPINAINILKQK